ncbi:hypothetical protein LWI28_008574 [Acer negundo]|uniref:Uncharacterized protein n=1 Tax=Acer negundo TaxID=4023 RepID=A0AAD5NXG2_ACENE|nr:hypothetical protein LWI28_008574 [Acer negundo]
MFGYRKLSKVNRICHGQANMWQAISNLLQMEKMYEDVNGRYKRLQKEKDAVDEKLPRLSAIVESQRGTIDEASTSYQRAKSLAREKQVKLCDYRERLKRANESIRWMKENLGDNAVDIFLASEDFAKIQKQTFDKAVKDVKALLLRSYPDFDFFAFDADVKMATESPVRKESDLVRDKSEDF